MRGKGSADPVGGTQVTGGLFQPSCGDQFPDYGRTHFPVVDPLLGHFFEPEPEFVRQAFQRSGIALLVMSEVVIVSDR